MQAINSSLTHRVSAGDITKIDYDVNLWSPNLKLSLPGRHGGERDNQKEGAKELVLVVEPVKEGDGLNRLTKTHLVGKDHRVIPEGKQKWIIVHVLSCR